MYKTFSSIDQIFDYNDSSDFDVLLLESVKSLVKINEIYKAYGLSRLIQSGYEAAEALIIIVENLPDPVDQKRAVEFLKKAGVLIFEVPEKWKQAEIHCRIALNFHKAGLESEAKDYFNRAIEIAKDGQASQNPQTSINSSSVLAEIAVTIASTGEKSRALEAAEEIKFSRKRENGIRAINSNDDH